MSLAKCGRMKEATGGGGRRGNSLGDDGQLEMTWRLETPFLGRREDCGPKWRRVGREEGASSNGGQIVDGGMYWRVQVIVIGLATNKPAR